MELAAIDEEKQESNLFERILFFVMPFLFVAVLLVVLLTLLNGDFRDKMIGVGQQIPVVKNWMPEPSNASLTTSVSTVRSNKPDSKIEELEAEIVALQNQLSEATTLKAEQEATISTLQKENESLKQQEVDTVEQSDESYHANILELASMFAKMTPSKAAPIIQSMTLDEMALLFSVMSPDNRARIMEKMNPQTAADVTMKLKDQTKAKDLQIAALQSRVDELSSNTEMTTGSQLADASVGDTFAGMDPGAAADLLLKMMDMSPSKVLRILEATNSKARSTILEEMSDRNEQAAAQLVTKLMTDS